MAIKSLHSPCMSITQSTNNHADVFLTFYYFLLLSWASHRVMPTYTAHTSSTKWLFNPVFQAKFCFWSPLSRSLESNVVPGEIVCKLTLAGLWTGAETSQVLTWAHINCRILMEMIQEKERMHLVLSYPWTVTLGKKTISEAEILRTVTDANTTWCNVICFLSNNVTNFT